MAEGDATSSRLTTVQIFCRAPVGVLDPERFTRMDLGEAWVRRTFGRHGRPVSGSHPGPR